MLVDMPIAMATDDDNYVLDDDGNRVLIGLSVDETREFEALHEFLSITNPNPPFSPQQWHSTNEKRWLGLYEKHQAALKPFLRTSKTKH
jgi:hypothetical protein